MTAGAPLWRVRSPQEVGRGWEGGSPSADSFEVSPPRFDWGARPWVLFIGSDESLLARAAADWLVRRGDAEGSFEILLPPEEALLPLLLHRISAAEGSGVPRYLFIPRLDRLFYNTLAGQASFCLVSPLYLLARLARSAGGGESVGFVATALGEPLSSHAPEILGGRGLAARFEVHLERGAKPAGHPATTPGPEELQKLEKLVAGETAPERLLDLGLATREPLLREQAYRRAISLAPDSAVAHLCLASALAEQKRLEESITELHQALSLSPDLDAAHYELAKLLIRADDLAGAVAGFRRTTELLPEFASAWSNLGAALGEMEDPQGAVAALDQAVGLDPLSHALHSNLGVALRNLGRYDEAAAEFKMALELAPDFVFGHYNLAYNCYFQGRYGEAIELFEKARDMDPQKTPRQRLLLALARLASGDVEGAHRDYRQILGELGARERTDLITVAEWDLGELERRRKGNPPVEKTLALVRSLGPPP